MPSFFMLKSICGPLSNACIVADHVRHTSERLCVPGLMKNEGQNKRAPAMFLLQRSSEAAPFIGHGLENILSPLSIKIILLSGTQLRPDASFPLTFLYPKAYIPIPMGLFSKSAFDAPCATAIVSYPLFSI